jgi:hypothetical protein
MKDSLVQAMQPLVQQCLDILKRDDIKNEFKILFRPIIEFILYEINPYIYIIVSVVFLILLINLVILIILIFLLHNKHLLNRIF